MIKKVVSIAIMTALLLNLGFTSAFASSNADNNHKQTQVALKALESKYKIKFSDMGTQNQVSIDGNTVQNMNFSSVEEFEKFVQELQKVKTLPTKAIGSTNENQLVRALAAGTVYSGSDRITWWAPFSGWGLNGVACWRNIDFNFKYTNRTDGRSEFVSVSNVTSYMSGITTSSWRQTAAPTVTLTTVNGVKNNAKFKILGNYFLGVSINGYPVGATIPGTWEAYYVLPSQI